MKYVVTVGDARVVVDLGPEGASVDGAACSVQLAEIEGTPVRLVTVGDRVHRIVVRKRHARGRYALWLDGFAMEAEALDERTRAIRDLTAQHEVHAGPPPIVAPMPGLIVRVTIQPGDSVHPGQGLVVMEAMKMENELRAHGAGKVRAVLVQPGTAVEKGALLIEFEDG